MRSVVAKAASRQCGLLRGCMMTAYDSMGFARLREPVALSSVSITGSFVSRTIDAAALADYRAMLEAHFPAARITIRTLWKPEGYGHARRVDVTPVSPPIGREQERQLGITRSDIGDLWRSMVGWPESL